VVSRLAISSVSCPKGPRARRDHRRRPCNQLSVVTAGEEAYKTLEKNLKDAGFKQDTPSFRWKREVEGFKRSRGISPCVRRTRFLEGKIYKPKTKVPARISVSARFNVSEPILQRSTAWRFEVEDCTGLTAVGASKVTVRVAGLLPYVVLNVNAFQDPPREQGPHTTSILLPGSTISETP
jgi:hypothetical protein